MDLTGKQPEGVADDIEAKRQAALQAEELLRLERSDEAEYGRFHDLPEDIAAAETKRLKGDPESERTGAEVARAEMRRIYGNFNEDTYQ